MALIHHCVAGVSALRLFYLIPALRVSGLEIHHRTNVSVDATGLCIDIYSFMPCFVVKLKCIGIENTVKVTEYLHIPNTMVKPFHRQAFKTAFALAVKIQIKINSRCKRRPCFEHSFALFHDRTQIVSYILIISVELFIIQSVHQPCPLPMFLLLRYFYFRLSPSTEP